MAFVMREPTADECEDNARLGEDGEFVYHAVWYPQMGGYVGKAVVKVGKGEDWGCFDAWVWHDGDFPFHEGEYPAELHHCAAQQFIRFGLNVRRMFHEANGR